MEKVKGKIALAVDPKGTWNACGWADAKDEVAMGLAVDSVEDGEARYWIEFEVFIPEEKTLKGKIVEGE